MNATHDMTAFSRPSLNPFAGLMNALADPNAAAEKLIHGMDQALRTLTHSHQASQAAPRPLEAAPAGSSQATALTEQETRLSAALMRVNHVGEVCAQALYSAQALATPDPALRAHFNAAAKEEVDHLVWTEQRLRELNSHTSRLNPLWYVGAFGIGLLAGRLGDRTSLGFVIETERQVEEHLDSHLSQLPVSDHASRAIVRQMRDDEVRHAEQAQDAGGVRPPEPVRWLMRAAAKVMTTTAHHI